jgi:hypothetical protein
MGITNKSCEQFFYFFGNTLMYQKDLINLRRANCTFASFYSYGLKGN